MKQKTLLSLGILAITLSAVGLVLGYSQWALSHTAVGHITITEPPQPDPTGNFIVPTSFNFPSTQRGQGTTATIHVTSTLNVDTQLTALDDSGVDGVTVTGGPVALPAGGSTDITLTLVTAPNAPLGDQAVSVVFTVKK